MAKTIAPIKNVQRLTSAFEQLKGREDEDGFALVFGAPGLGKTVTTCSLFVRENGILVRAKPGWTQKALLKTLLAELGSDFRGTNAECLDEAIRLTAESSRPIFVDEADALFNDARSLETLRSIHDVCGIPVVLVGMTSLPSAPGIDRRIKRYPQLSSRITQWVEFYAADWEDATTLARHCCEVAVGEDLLERLLTSSKGNIRLMRRGLTRIQRLGKARRLDQVSNRDWGDRELFFAAS